MPTRRGNLILFGLGSKPAADLVDALLLSTIALLGFVLLWASIWAMTDGAASLGTWLPFSFELSAPSVAPSRLLRDL